MEKFVDQFMNDRLSPGSPLQLCDSDDLGAAGQAGTEEGRAVDHREGVGQADAGTVTMFHSSVLFSRICGICG